MLDYLAATFAGAQLVKSKGNKLLDNLEDTQKSSHVIGYNREASVSNSILLNGFSSHMAELDDGVISGIVHPGSPVISALLPVAEKEKVSGEDLLRGIIIGYEATVRIADAIQPSHKFLGYHATGTCGTIGAGAGIAAMLNYSRSKLKETISAATVSASGRLKVLEDDSELKPFNVSNAAHSGYIASCMAEAGFVGPDDVFSGNTGFLSIMANEYDISYITDRINDELGINRVYVKPYAACRYCHPAIEAALYLRKNEDIKINNINKVSVNTYALSVTNHDHTEINGISSAKMSIPYSVAVALITGRAGINEFKEEFISNLELTNLCKKISVYPDAELTKQFPEKSVSIVAIETNNDKIYKYKVDLAKGEPDNPLSNKEIEDKFISLGKFNNKTEDICKEIVSVVWNIEKDLESLFSLL